MKQWIRKLFRTKWHFIINTILLAIALINLWLGYTYKYTSFNNTMIITYILTACISMNNAIQHKIEGKKKEFITDIFCCALFVVLGIYYYYLFK